MNSSVDAEVYEADPVTLMLSPVLATGPTLASGNPPGDTGFAGPLTDCQTGFPQGGNSGRFESCVSGRVLAADGSPIGAASGNVNNGSSSVQWTTNGDGFFRVCGLGYSNWGAVLFYIPGPGLRSEAAIYGIWLDGSAGQQAFVVFKAR